MALRKICTISRYPTLTRWSKMNPLSENCCVRNEVIFKFLNLDIEDHVGSDSYNCQDRVVGFPLR